ncbi:hypothetical protein KSB_65150 [Ktedonobacter robiniae]|uniref:Uncharacterized protein n=1 Tax=Ktedonobacter robiniae TaxID=2778365 RepID=A0ABQ3V0A4_9CHLR|nr:hypothetical protein KSB_65150 [Ktedonobacter robiniae]
MLCSQYTKVLLCNFMVSEIYSGATMHIDEVAIKEYEGKRGFVSILVEFS